MKHDEFDIVVIGAGHAGTEAAHAGWRMGLKVALVTFRESDIGVMSCNPAIGGLGKGHLVREIDALDGIMGRVADKAAIQFRLLNRRKGPAVRGPRVQADRQIYQQEMKAELRRAVGLRVIEGEVVDLTTDSEGAIDSVVLADGSVLRTKSTILTSGTFLKGLMHVGEEKTSGGRNGAKSSVRLADRLLDFGVRTGRLKTGTPPRLSKRSINYAGLDIQEGDETPTLFSFMHQMPFIDQVSCAITHTNDQTHDVIRKNLSRSAMYGGMIDGTGPRYCPSIEDKVVRFPDKLSHQIFLEPEGLGTDLIYPNGISTSLPLSVQLEYVRSIKGLENAEIVQAGYAIEYDFVDPIQITSGLALKSVPGLFLAGQVNGTTGYEEAAAQGLVAGLNASIHVKGGDPVRFSRSSSYIGVMLDDLTTKGVTEPYRMFTSRAEHRLVLRADNADARLTQMGIDLGCVGFERQTSYTRKRDGVAKVRKTLEETQISANNLKSLGLASGPSSSSKSAFELLGRPDCDIEALCDLVPGLKAYDREVVVQNQCDAIYSTYIERQEREIDRVRVNESVIIPDDIDYKDIEGISNEVREKLIRVKPETLAQAGRIEGVTASAIVTLLAYVKRIPYRQAS